MGMLHAATSFSAAGYRAVLKLVAVTAGVEIVKAVGVHALLIHQPIV
jgi:hypothetical protein